MEGSTSTKSNVVETEIKQPKAKYHVGVRKYMCGGHSDSIWPATTGGSQYSRCNVSGHSEALLSAARFFGCLRPLLKFLKRTMKRYGRPWSIVTDRLRSYSAAMQALGNSGRQECGRWLNNRAENSHLSFRRREGAMARFRGIKTLQKFTAAHSSIYNHFNHERHLNRRDIFKQICCIPHILLYVAARIMLRSVGIAAPDVRIRQVSAT